MSYLIKKFPTNIVEVEDHYYIQVPNPDEIKSCVDSLVNQNGVKREDIHIYRVIREEIQV